MTSNYTQCPEQQLGLKSSSLDIFIYSEYFHAVSV